MDAADEQRSGVNTRGDATHPEAGVPVASGGPPAEQHTASAHGRDAHYGTAGEQHAAVRAIGYGDHDPGSYAIASDGHPDGHGYAHRHGDRHTITDCHGDRHAVTDCHGNGHAVADRHGNGNANCHGNPDRHAITDRNCLCG